MRRWLPSIDLCRWGGAGIASDADFDGWCIAIEWLGLTLELCAGRRVRG